MTSIIKSYPTLYKRDKSDKIRVWTLSATKHNDETYWIEIDYGQKDGKIIHNEKQVKEGKNIGKKNETTTEQQLILICDKTFKDKVEKEQYSCEHERDKEDVIQKYPYSPMLADKWDPNIETKRKVDIMFPCYVQPKLDGIRCLTYLKDEDIVNQSRQLKYFKNLNHINNELKKIFNKFSSLVLDGELYNHNIVFNKIAGIVKKEKLKDEDKENLKLIEYHIYDCFLVDNMNLSFEERIKILKKLKDLKYVKIVPTLLCKEKDEIISKFHPQFTGDSYEGTILRNKDSIYEFTRTRNLQKYKNFEDDEFEIIDFKEGTGHDSGTVIWKCKTKEGKEFEVRPVGTVENRSELLKNASKCIGKFLTVTYQELSEFGVPRFPVGKTIRDYE